MSQLTRICATLNATAVPSPRPKAEPATHGLSSALNRTILPRWVELHLHGGTCIRLLVRNRRLHRLKIDGNDPDVGDALGPEHSKAVADLLRTLCNETEIEILRTHPLGQDEGIEGLGIAAETLVADVVPPTGAFDGDTDLQTRIATFASENEMHLDAAFVVADLEIAHLAGSEDRADHVMPEVSEVLSRLKDENSAMGAAIETDGILVLPRAADPAGCLLIAGALGLLGVLVLQDLTPTEALTRWQASITG